MAEIRNIRELEDYLNTGDLTFGLSDTGISVKSLPSVTGHPILQVRHEMENRTYEMTVGIMDGYVHVDRVVWETVYSEEQKYSYGYPAELDSVLSSLVNAFNTDKPLNDDPELEKHHFDPNLGMRDDE